MTLQSILRGVGYVLGLTLSTLSAFAQPTFEGGPDPRRGVFVKAADPLDDVRYFCVDLFGHMEWVDVSAPLHAHTCKDGFWNYDGRFEEAMERDQLRMPAYKKCLGAGKVEVGSNVFVFDCDEADTRQSWEYADGRLRLKHRPDLCLSIADVPSEVSVGTRNHPVRHLVRPLVTEECAPAAANRQSWVFAPPSDVPGVRYPDGSIR